MDGHPEMQNAFMNATSLADITRLAIDDLEAQCLKPTKRMGAAMAHWLKVETHPKRGYTLCSVCLGGACLVNRGWINPLDHETLARIYREEQEDTDAIMLTLPYELADRLSAIDHIRNLNVNHAVETLGDTSDRLNTPELLERGKKLKETLKRASAENRSDPVKTRDQGSNYLSYEHTFETLTPEKLVDSIRFFRRIVIPELAKARM